MDLREAIELYTPFNAQEEADRRVILDALDHDGACFERISPAHVTCSIWTVDAAAQRTLLVHHNIYNSWSWVGGHADGERELAAVALSELREETGVAGANLVECGPGGIFSIEVLPVAGHERRGRYVSSHTHLNITYLAVADPAEPLVVCAEENSAVRWVPMEDAIALSNEPWIRDRIYRKLIDKLRRHADWVA